MDVIPKATPCDMGTGMKTKEDARPKENAKTEKPWGLDDTMSWMQLWDSPLPLNILVSMNDKYS